MEIRYYGDKITHHIAKTPEGFLICQDVPISRTGYQTYLSSEMFDSPSNGHRAIPVYRPAEEVFDVKSLASFEGKPVTNEHPDEDVKPENYSRYACGHVQNVHVGTGADSNKVLADLYITDPHLIDLIQHGKREISCGYYAEERRDAAGRICQTRIRGNHVAVVRNGRAGKNVCIRDKKPDALCRRKDYGVKGMKKGVRKAVEKAGEIAGAAGHVAKRLGRAGLAGAKAGLNSAAHSLPARAAVRAGKFAGRTAVGAGKLAGKAWLGGVKKVVGTPAKAGLAVAKSAAKNALRGAKPIAKGVLKGAKKAVEFAKNSVEKQPAYKVATFAKRHIGNALANSSAAKAARREFAKEDSMYWDDELYRDYGVKGMKKGVRKAIKEIGAYAKHRLPTTHNMMEQGTAAGITAHKIASAIGNTRVGSAIANSKLGKSKFDEGAKKAAKAGLALGAAFAPIPGMKLVNYHNLRQARKRSGNSAHDSAMYYNLLGGNRMRKRRYLYDEEPFIDDDELLVDELLKDDDYFDEDEFVDSCAKDDDYLEDEDEFVDACKDDDYLEDEDEFEDDDYLEDEDEFEDDEYMEDDDEFVDSDEFEDDDEEFADDDEILADEDEFADDDEIMDDDDELMADDDELMADDDFEDNDAEEISASAKEVIADAADLLRAARRKHKLGLRKDAIILNDDDLEEDDDEGLIESDADLHDDDYLADDDFEDDEDILADDDDELMADDDEEFTDSDDFEDDDELMADDDEEFADDDVEVTENSESEVLDEDKTRALREITEASRGISDPNERKHLQDAIYNALCNRTQMKDIMRITKKNARSRMDSANTNKNKVNVADQQSIYDSFNPHKKTSF